MITPYLEAKQGWKMPLFLHDDLRPILAGTHGVVVFHEQVIEIIQQFTGCTFAEADEWRRALGDVEGMADTRLWFYPRALARGYDRPLVERVWKVIEAFASFGFCKAHAAAFALPTYQSAWLKAHYPAHFLSGVLTHDPGHVPQAADPRRRPAARHHDPRARRQRLRGPLRRGAAVDPTPTRPDETAGCRQVQLRWSLVPVLGERASVDRGAAGGSGSSLADVKGITGAEVARIVAAREGAPYASLTDFWQRAQVSRPVAERLVQAGAFDTVYGIGATGDLRRRGRVTRRDLLLQVADLDRHGRALERAARGRAPSGRRPARQIPIEGQEMAGPGCPCANGRRPSPGPRGRPHRSPRCSSRSTSATDRPRGRAAGCRR